MTITGNKMLLAVALFAITASASSNATVAKIASLFPKSLDDGHVKPAAKAKLALIQTDIDELPATDAVDPPAASAVVPSASSSLETLTAAMSGASGPSTPESRKQTTAAMEAAIMALMSGKTAFGATPMGGSVQKIVNILTKDMMPKVNDAHKADQENLNALKRELMKCFSSKRTSLIAARPWWVKYKKESVSHKKCRGDEAVRRTSKTSCLAEQKAKYQVKVLKCNYFAAESRLYGTDFNNKKIVQKTAGEESVGQYIYRISNTICGIHEHGTKGQKSTKGGWGGGLRKGMYDKYLRAKDACEVATREYNAKVKECKEKIHLFNVKKAKCNGFQVDMDARSCKHAILQKDTCEQYANCYMSRRKALEITIAKVKMEERDRKAEWRGLTRISCLIGAFSDGSVTDKEVDACKSKVVSTKHLIIKYPKIPEMQKCPVTKLYPATGAYKRAEFAPLPSLAKGQASVPCSGVEDIPTTPRKGSPKSCKCSRVTLEGHYHAGPLVACKGCLDVRRSKDKSSCPHGTKIFAPATRGDWKTFLASAPPLRKPNWIIDITRPQNGCGGCTSNAMNSKNRNQASWKTSDGAPWWLRSLPYGEPSGDYAANCFMDLGKKKPTSENHITMNDARCNYHSTAYYCQKFKLFMTPKPGSPSSCKCQQVVLASAYSAKILVKCEQCLTVYRSTQKNSCPAGMKIFSPRSRADWKSVLVSAQPLRAPHWIIDVTRPQNGCGGCGKYPMNSRVPQQATWRTSDGSPWWLRSIKYSEPNGDYKANCFMNLHASQTSENTLKFNDHNCRIHSRSYYCQPKMKKRVIKKKVAPKPQTRRIYPNSLLQSGLKEEIFYFKQGRKVPSFRGRTASMIRKVTKIQYKNNGRNWPGYTQKDNFAVRWSGVLLITTGGTYLFHLTSDDGSNLYVDNKRVINNDGLHGWTSRAGSVRKMAAGQHKLRVEFFERGGSAGMYFRYKGADTKSKGRGVVFVGGKAVKYVRERGFKEEIFYLKAKDIGKSMPKLNSKTADAQRVVPFVEYASTKNKWMGFRQADFFAARWSGILFIRQAGAYRFSLKSDDGSKMYFPGRKKELFVDNDGLHGMKNVESTIRLRRSYNSIIVEFFEKAGNAGMSFRYMGPQTGSKMINVPRKSLWTSWSPVRTPDPPKKKVVKKAAAAKKVR